MEMNIYKVTFHYKYREESALIAAKNKVKVLLSKTVKRYVDDDMELLDIHVDNLGEVVIEND